MAKVGAVWWQGFARLRTVGTYLAKKYRRQPDHEPSNRIAVIHLPQNLRRFKRETSEDSSNAGVTMLNGYQLTPLSLRIDEKSLRTRARWACCGREEFILARTDRKP